MILEANSLLRGKSSVYKGKRDVEDEEGDETLLATAKLLPSPSILFTTNQDHGNRENSKFPDWCSSGF